MRNLSPQAGRTLTAPKAASKVKLIAKVRSIISPSNVRTSAKLITVGQTGSGQPDLLDDVRKATIIADEVPCVVDLQKHEAGRPLCKRTVEITERLLLAAEPRIGAGEIEW